MNRNKQKNIILFFLLVTFLTGCATIPTRETLPTYSIGGITYLPLITLCDLKNIDWQYDTFAKTLTLYKAPHKINLMVGDTLVLVDGIPQHINNPVDIYQGTVVVPYKFKEQILDRLFKQAYPTTQTSPILKIKKIVIDAGHGGKDPGAIGKTGVREKDVNLDIAKRLSRLLGSEGIEVIMTRNTDRFISLSRRAEIANNSRADLFIAIHSNANRVRSLNGLEVYYVSTNVNDSKRAYAAAKSAVLNLDNAYFASSSQDLKAILWDMLYTSNRAESIELSRSLCRALNDNLGVKILGIKGAGFQVLKEVRMPAVLIEVGFLSNYNEEHKLRNNYYRQKIAEGILDGIRHYARSSSFLETARR